MVASSASFTCPPALATTSKFGLVAAPFMYRGFEKQFEVPHKSFTPDLFFLFFMYSTIFDSLFSDSKKLGPS